MPSADWVCWQCHVQNIDAKPKCIVCGAERKKEAIIEKSGTSVSGVMMNSSTAETTSDSSTIPVDHRRHPVILIFLYCLGIAMIVLFILECLSGFALGGLLNQSIRRIDIVSLQSRIIEVFASIRINGVKNLKNLQWEGPFMLAYEKCLQIPSWARNAKSIIQYFDRFFVSLMFCWLISHLIMIWQDCANQKKHHIIWRCLRIFLVDFFLVTAVILIPTSISVTVQCLQGMLSLQTVVLAVAFVFSFFMFGRRKRLSSQNKNSDIIWYALSTVVMYLTAVFVL